MYGLRIIVADSDTVFRNYLKEKLLTAGYTIVGETSDGRSALQMVYNIQPDLVIVSTQLAGRNGVEVAEAIGEHRLSPVLLLAEPNDQENLIHSLAYGTFSYIVKPIDDANLISSIEVCTASFKRLGRLEEENRRLKQTIETRKIVERAKGLLVEYKGMTENQAFQYIQKLSMDKCLPAKSVAQQIIKSLGLKSAPKKRNHS